MVEENRGVDLPLDFKTYIIQCHQLMKEIRHIQKHREDFNQFEINLYRPKVSLDILLSPVFYDVLRYWS